MTTRLICFTPRETPVDDSSREPDGVTHQVRFCEGSGTYPKGDSRCYSPKLLVRFCEGRGWQLVRPLVHGGTVNPPRNRKGETGNPPPTEAQDVESTPPTRLEEQDDLNPG